MSLFARTLHRATISSGSLQFQRLYSTASNNVHTKTLANGVQVVSVDGNGPAAAVGVFIKGGAKYESHDTSGSAHFLRHFALKSTANLSSLRVTRLIEANTTSYTVKNGREGIQYKAETLQSQVPVLLAVLGDLVRPRLPEWEVRDVREYVAADRETRLADANFAISEAVHFAAFRGAGLGRPVVAPTFQIDSLTHEALQQYVAETYVGKRITVVGVGVDATVFASEVEKAFGDLAAGAAAPDTNDAAQYRGGERADLGADGTRVSIAFQGVSYNSSDALAANALAHALGGGVSLRGSPGSGLTSRLYRAITSNCATLRSARAFNLSYANTGLFGVQGLAASGNAAPLTELLANELRSVANSISDEEAARAVAQARFAAAQSADTRLGALELLGKQALTGVTPSLATADSASLSTADLKRVAKKIFSTSPTLVAIGDVANLPTVDRVRQIISS